MNTGTPLDLTLFGSVLTGIGILYCLVALAGTALALWLPKRGWIKAVAALTVLAAFGFPVVNYVGSERQQRQQADARSGAAKARFEERCKTAGERILRTVEDVDGVVWMKWRPDALNFSDQFKLDDPYGQDCVGDKCIEHLLRATRGTELNPEEAKRHTKGYRFVESIDPKSGQRYRYVGAMKLSPSWTPELVARHKQETGRAPSPSAYLFSLEREPIGHFTARYGITWDDISTREDREHWIAGGSLKVIDLQTNEVVAERVGYMMDRGQGSRAGFRSPWSFAVQNACPSFSHEPNDSRRGRTLHETRDFVLKVLQPRQGE